MSPEDIKDILIGKYPDKLKETKLIGFEPAFIIEKDALIEICRYARESHGLSFDLLSCMVGADYADRFEVIYILFSFANKHKMSLRVQLPRENPEVDSLTSVWQGANWYEREITELFGIKFRNHPDPRPILLPEDWDEGHPLRKDWSGKDFKRMPDFK